MTTPLLTQAPTTPWEAMSDDDSARFQWTAAPGAATVDLPAPAAPPVPDPTDLQGWVHGQLTAAAPTQQWRVATAGSPVAPPMPMQVTERHVLLRPPGRSDGLVGLFAGLVLLGLPIVGAIALGAWKSAPAKAEATQPQAQAQVMQAQAPATTTDPNAAMWDPNAAAPGGAATDPTGAHGAMGATGGTPNSNSTPVGPHGAGNGNATGPGGAGNGTTPPNRPTAGGGGTGGPGGGGPTGGGSSSTTNKPATKPASKPAASSTATKPSGSGGTGSTAGSGGSGASTPAPQATTPAPQATTPPAQPTTPQVQPTAEQPAVASAHS